MANCDGEYVAVSGAAALPFAVGVDDRDESILVLAGTDVDVEFDVEVDKGAKEAGYTLLTWSIHIPTEAQWVRVAGAWHNIGGQTSPDRTFDLNQPLPIPSQKLKLTVSGTRPPPQGGYFPNADYSTVITLTYTASGPLGTCTRTRDFLLSIKVLEAIRYYHKDTTFGPPTYFAELQPPTLPTSVSSPIYQQNPGFYLYIINTYPQPQYGTVGEINYYEPSFGFEAFFNFVRDINTPRQTPGLTKTVDLYHTVSIDIPIAQSPPSDVQDGYGKESFHLSIEGVANGVVIPVTSYQEYYKYLTSPPISSRSKVVARLYKGVANGTQNPYWYNAGYVFRKTEVWVSTTAPPSDYFKKQLSYYSSRVSTPLGQAPTPPTNEIVILDSNAVPLPNDVIPFSYEFGSTTSVSIALTFDFSKSTYMLVAPFPTLEYAAADGPFTTVTPFTVTASNNLIYSATLGIKNNSAIPTGIHQNVLMGNLKWSSIGGSVSLPLYAHVTVTAPTSSPPPSGPPPSGPPPSGPPPSGPPPSGPPPSGPPPSGPPPSGPPPSGPPPTTDGGYTGPPLAADGTTLAAVPFDMSVYPLEIKVQADRQTGLFSGDFEVGILIKPGPTQYRMAEVVDLVTLHATGDPQVQFFPQKPYQETPDVVEVSVTPVSWDLYTNYFYDLTCEVYVTNNSPQDRTISLGVSVAHLDGIDQTEARLDKGQVFVRSGTTEVVLLALAVSAYELARSEVTVTAMSDGLKIAPQRVLINCDPAASIPVYYQITTGSTQILKVGTPVSIQFATISGPAGPETWGVSDPEFLSNHNLRFTAGGLLKSDGTVMGPATQKSVVFTVRKETGPRTRVYASKIIDLVIQP